MQFDAQTEQLRNLGYTLEFYSHSRAILSVDFPEAWADIVSTLADFNIPISEIIGSGGGEAKGTQRLRNGLSDKGWKKHNFEIEKRIDKVTKESISHEIDHVKFFPNQPALALEIEWNNKDPFFDRDLENFKRLHAEGVISVGMIVTRGADLQAEMQNHIRRFVVENNIRDLDDLKQFGYEPTSKQRSSIRSRIERPKNPLSFEDAFVSKFVSDKFGMATTHWAKLEDRVHRGVGNPCPLVLIGLPANIIVH